MNKIELTDSEREDLQAILADVEIERFNKEFQNQIKNTRNCILRQLLKVEGEGDGYE